MKPQTPVALQFVIVSSLLLLLNSCMKDNCRHTYSLYTPIYKSLSEVRANLKSNPAQDLQRPGKIYVYGNYIFLNEYDKGIHIIDNSQPSNPQNIAFINIPGNLDLAVQGNTLYADMYCDLIAFDISNPRNVVAKKFLNNIFPQRNGYYYNLGSNNPDSIKLIADWSIRDTTVDCVEYNYLYETFYSQAKADASGSFSSPGLSGGQGGSMARFAILKNYLYAVTYTDLNVINISTPQNPAYTGKSNIGNWNIETIYPFQDKLFIGSSNGMFIYDVATPGSPAKLAQFFHATACDPVVADGKYAWVTLRTGNVCQGFSNVLEVVNISNLTSPSLLKTYNMTNPHGLSVDGNLLFVCDGKDGLKIYNTADASDLQLIKHITGLETSDVIAWSGKALVVAKNGLYQFDYSDLNNIRLISKIGLHK